MAIYALLDTTDTTIIQYPLTIYQIRGLFPTSSWPDAPTADQLLPFHLVIVTEVVPPAYTKNTIVTEGTPVNTSGVWTQVYTITTLKGHKSKRQVQKDNIAAKRYEKEVSGIFWNNHPVDTSRDSQVKLNAVYNLIKNGIFESGKWKFKNGKFEVLSASQLEELYLAVIDHITHCYETEAELIDWIDTQVSDASLEQWSWPN